MAETFIFLSLSVAFSWLLWQDRPARGRTEGLRLLRTFVIVLLPWTAFVGAMISNNGDRLTVRVNQLRVPQSVVANSPWKVLKAKAEAAFQPYLIVGDRPEIADLVVAPYVDQSLSRISMPPDARRFVTVEARLPTDGPIEAQLRLQSFEASPEAEMPGMGVVLDGKRILPGDGQTVGLALGVPRRIIIERIDSDGRWAERRGFTVALRGGIHPAVELDLISPMVADAGTCELPQLRLSPMASGDAPTPGFRDPENLVFNGLGAGGRDPVIDPRWLGPITSSSLLCAQTQTNFSWPSSLAHDDARLRLVSQKVFLPWYCCIFTMLCTLALHWLCARGWRDAAPERIVVPLLQWLLMLRLLVAVAGYYNDMSVIPWRALWDGMASYLCVPALAVILLRPGRGRTLAPLMIGIAVLVAAGFAALLVSLRAIDWTGIAEILCYATIALAIARTLLPGEDSPLAIAVRFIGPPMGGDTSGTVARRWMPASAFSTGLIIVAALIAFRLILVGIGLGGGAKLTERLFGMPLSLIFVPGMILGFALLLDGARSMTQWRALLWIVPVFIAAYVVVPVATRDIGSIFVCAWPLAAVIAWFGFRHTKEHPGPVNRIWWMIPVAIPALIIAGFGVLLFVEGPIPSPVPVQSDQVGKIEVGETEARRLGPFIAEATRWDRNQVRMLAFFAPNRAEQLGTKFAFESLDLTSSLGPLTSDLFGRGYLAPSNVRPPLLDNQYFENLPAVHLIWPLGRLGTLGLLIVILAAACSLHRGEAGELQGAPEWPSLVSLLARCTFVWAALYMILANLNWVPFTGRNVYLLAVSSGGDLPEGLLLVLMMCLSFALARPGGEAR